MSPPRWPITAGETGGFTLAEVVAAVFVLGLLGVVVVGVLAPGAEWSAARADRGFAHRAARSTLEVLLANEFSLLVPGRSQPVPVPGHTHATVEVVIRDVLPGVKEVEVTAVAGDQEVALSCLKGRWRP